MVGFSQLQKVRFSQLFANMFNVRLAGEEQDGATLSELAKGQTLSCRPAWSVEEAQVAPPHRQAGYVRCSSLAC